MCKDCQEKALVAEPALSTNVYKSVELRFLVSTKDAPSILDKASLILKELGVEFRGLSIYEHYA